MASSLLQQDYSLNTGESSVQITLISSGAYMTEAGSSTQVQSVSYGQIGTAPQNPLAFTVYSADTYVLAMVETQYLQVNLPAGVTVDPPSYCHIYFKLGSTDWLWATDAQTADNVTVFTQGSGESMVKNIDIQSPTEVNPNGIVSEFPALNSDLVFLLDKNSKGNMLFRGNEPLKAGMSDQSIDFTQLHQVLQTKYNLQTGLSDFPAIGSYILRDIAFLNPLGDEEDILSAEIASFNATSTTQVNQTWYPVQPTVALSGGMLGQVANWNVEPSTAALDLNIEMAQNLSTWMDTQLEDAAGNSIPTVYYIHCSSGHDRTGMMASAYLMQNYSLDLSEAFILGTTIHMLGIPMGGNVIQNCYDITADTVDPNRSRCFVAGDGTDSHYNNTVLAMSNALYNISDSAFSTDALSGDPAIGTSGKVYVHAYYPWKYTCNPISLPSLQSLD